MKNSSFACYGTLPTLLAISSLALVGSLGSEAWAQAVSIDQPSIGTEVGSEVTVRGTVANGSDLERLAVIVRPDPDKTNQDWWVQERPTKSGGGNWSAAVHIGDANTPSGMVFRICAVVTSLNVKREDRLSSLPDGPSDCVDVKKR